jgi:TusA-related sulfurtransferase
VLASALLVLIHFLACRRGLRARPRLPALSAPNAASAPAVKSFTEPRRTAAPRLSLVRSLSMEIQIHKEVDARGLLCPLPILRAKKALADMQTGQILKVLATDPGSQRDFAAFAKQTGNEIVESTSQDKVFTFLMKRR